MLTIILSACLVANPSECRNFELPLAVEMDVRRCAMVAPPYFARWIDEHPQWQIKGWKCKPAAQKDT
ncbi:hypothetical protein [Hyphomicrobium sp.]|uniref:hypothetical protein n=1 Tax=Hyphomicrobium sp. TaxID=82 RepID=UPI002C5C0990|nr:hypothetical protein [Hyphomicrobium sp.]HRN89390.1 hypothetical protein [Hyphomicrobium sp.]HRQ27539.1 hypothetical protein [Hyphomicrobium sp.]